MIPEHSTASAKHLYRYSIASGDMYFTELGLRDVILRTDEQGNFRIQAETVGEGNLGMITLCEIFLEYAMYCCTWCNREEALCHMLDFGKHIGHSIGEYLKESTALLESSNPIDYTLEHLFQTMNAHFSIQHSEAMERFTVIDYPLEDAAERSGIRDIELAHCGMNMMCQNIIQAINPQVVVAAAPTIRPEFDFTIWEPVPA